MCIGYEKQFRKSGQWFEEILMVSATLAIKNYLKI